MTEDGTAVHATASWGPFPSVMKMKRPLTAWAGHPRNPADMTSAERP
jgi:hypothetical protein